MYADESNVQFTSAIFHAPYCIHSDTIILLFLCPVVRFSFTNTFFFFHRTPNIRQRRHTYSVPLCHCRWCCFCQCYCRCLLLWNCCYCCWHFFLCYFICVESHCLLFSLFSFHSQWIFIICMLWYVSHQIAPFEISSNQTVLVAIHHWCAITKYTVDKNVVRCGDCQLTV